MINKDMVIYNTMSEWCKITKLDKRVNVAIGAYKSYLKSNDTRLEDVYNTYSKAKLNAYNCIINEMYKMNGYGFTIISHTVNMFTCGYCVDVYGDKYFVRHTASYRDVIKVG